MVSVMPPGGVPWGVPPVAVGAGTNGVFGYYGYGSPSANASAQPHPAPMPPTFSFRANVNFAESSGFPPPTLDPQLLQKRQAQELQRRRQRVEQHQQTLQRSHQAGQTSRCSPVKPPPQPQRGQKRGPMQLSSSSTPVTSPTAPPIKSARLDAAESRPTPLDVSRGQGGPPRVRFPASAVDPRQTLFVDCSVEYELPNVPKVADDGKRLLAIHPAYCRPHVHLPPPPPSQRRRHSQANSFRPSSSCNDVQQRESPFIPPTHSNSRPLEHLPHQGLKTTTLQRLAEHPAHLARHPPMVCHCSRCIGGGGHYLRHATSATSSTSSSGSGLAVPAPMLAPVVDKAAVPLAQPPKGESIGWNCSGVD